MATSLTLKLYSIVFQLALVIIVLNVFLYALNNMHCNGMDEEALVNPFRKPFVVKSLVSVPLHFSSEDSLYMSVSIQENSSKREPVTTSSTHKPIILLKRPLHHFPKQYKPLKETGIVFYVYYPNHCANSDSYMKQAELNAKYFKQLDPSTNIAIVTNCPIPASTYPFIDIIYPIDESDVPDIKGKQWFTRILYNAYPPFTLNFIIDTHVFPCDSMAVRELFDRFNASGVDVSFSNRELPSGLISGGAVLSRNSPNSHRFWKSCYRYMQLRNQPDDQGGMIPIRSFFVRFHLFHFEWLSSNWFFAHNGIGEDGIFFDASDCYRSSVVVNGPIRFVHYSADVCELMNGPGNAYVNRSRIYYSRGTCSCSEEEKNVLFDVKELRERVCSVTLPSFRWNEFASYPSRDLFWPRN